MNSILRLENNIREFVQNQNFITERNSAKISPLNDVTKNQDIISQRLEK
jgi:hypothetical protein